MAVCLNYGAVARGRKVSQDQFDANRLVKKGQLPYRFVPRRGVPAATGIVAHAAQAKAVVFHAVAVPNRQPHFAIPDLPMGISNARRIEENPVKRAPGAATFVSGHFHFLALLALGDLFGGNGLNRSRMQAHLSLRTPWVYLCKS